mmetsp:Transcript_82173/g.245098  ORF Transcript_82173/g.245098 Transcript_82173/m.245098 type:complete len:250 (-) Transcript_82173:457-1206(-)
MEHHDVARGVKVHLDLLSEALQEADRYPREDGNAPQCLPIHVEGDLAAQVQGQHRIPENAVLYEAILLQVVVGGQDFHPHVPGGACQGHLLLPERDHLVANSGSLAPDLECAGNVCEEEPNGGEACNVEHRGAKVHAVTEGLRISTPKGQQGGATICLHEMRRRLRGQEAGHRDPVCLDVGFKGRRARTYVTAFAREHPGPPAGTVVADEQEGREGCRHADVLDVLLHGFQQLNETQDLGQLQELHKLA